jgi:dihydrofolate reductase
MATLLYGMNVSLDGYVDHDKFMPDQTLFRHFIEQARGLTGSLYGRKLYELMRYWDSDDPDWSADFRAFAEAWRAQKKWVVSRTLTELGPNAVLIKGDVAAAAKDLKREQTGEIEVGGPDLASTLIGLGVIDTYQLYVHPVVLGGGNPFFLRATPKLQFVESLRIGDSAIRLTYRPA